MPCRLQNLIKTFTRDVFHESEEGAELYPSKIQKRKGYITIVDNEQNYHSIKECDLMSCRRYQQRLPCRSDLKIPHAYLMRVSTLTAIWLVRIMANNLPDDMANVDLDYNGVIDLHPATEHFGIFRNASWLEQLLASRVTCNPWECLAKALNVSRVDNDLAETIISLLPYSALITFTENSALAVEQSRLPEGVDSAIARLANQPLPRWTTHRVIGGDVTLKTGPWLALVMASRSARDEDQCTNLAADSGCPMAQERLARSIAVDFSRYWRKIQKLAGSATWMSSES